MPEKSRDMPTYEDALEKLGLDRMSFFSGMVRPDQHEVERGQPINKANRSHAR